MLQSFSYFAPLLYLTQDTGGTVPSCHAMLDLEQGYLISSIQVLFPENYRFELISEVKRIYSGGHPSPQEG